MLATKIHRQAPIPCLYTNYGSLVAKIGLAPWQMKGEFYPFFFIKNTIQGGQHGQAQITLHSTRRFCSRPAAEVFGAVGWLFP